ncbi:MAG: hypothetical protein C0605_09170 [Hyphomicrobiales bacterium]|nr:MAG: hypothetical protein C0605_09170 [Hyphomicrobiales bacterium]
MSKDDTDNYEVGYAKTPIHSRFKKGQSGNPKGRPKGQKNAATIIQKALNEKVTVNVNGHRRKMSKLEASLQVVQQKALKGDLKAFQQLIILAKEAGMLREEFGDNETPFPVDEKNLIEAFLKRASGTDEESGGPCQPDGGGEKS